mmetsp:Transcript_49259/g.97437  ORF Transcript_49259/g.97437 Transcript_49259/m.97437 type:complete len:210 (-) Transcript_49259:32-661(-)
MSDTRSCCAVLTRREVVRKPTPEIPPARLVGKVPCGCGLVAGSFWAHGHGDAVPVVYAAPVRVEVGLRVLGLHVPRSVESFRDKRELHWLPRFQQRSVLLCQRHLSCEEHPRPLGAAPLHSQRVRGQRQRSGSSSGLVLRGCRATRRRRLYCLHRLRRRLHRRRLHRRRHHRRLRRRLVRCWQRERLVFKVCPREGLAVVQTHVHPVHP